MEVKEILCPTKFKDFLGQTHLRSFVELYLSFVKQSGHVPVHNALLLCGGEKFNRLSLGVLISAFYL